MLLLQLACVCSLLVSMVVFVNIRELPRVAVMLLLEPLPRLVLYMCVYFIAAMDSTAGALYAAALLLLDLHVQNVVHYKGAQGKK